LAVKIAEEIQDHKRLSGFSGLSEIHQDYRGFSGISWISQEYWRFFRVSETLGNMADSQDH
jgi:hypothetical protein